MVIREDSTWSDPELGCCKATDTFWRCGAGMGGAGVQEEWALGLQTAVDAAGLWGGGGDCVSPSLR